MAGGWLAWGGLSVVAEMAVIKHGLKRSLFRYDGHENRYRCPVGAHEHSEAAMGVCRAGTYSSLTGST